jgi:hypothetical protein
MGRDRRSRVVRQNGERSCHWGRVQNNSTLGYLTKQPCAAALTSTLPRPQFVLHLISFFVCSLASRRRQSDTSVS